MMMGMPACVAIVTKLVVYSGHVITVVVAGNVEAMSPNV